MGCSRWDADAGGAVLASVDGRDGKSGEKRCVKSRCIIIG